MAGQTECVLTTDELSIFQTDCVSKGKSGGGDESDRTQCCANLQIVAALTANYYFTVKLNEAAA